jgi:putative tryptophan/tyrosine transport system substrate-binding protein
VIEWRSAEGSIERANALAEELVRLQVSVIVVEFTPAAQAAKKATATIPIVLASAGDPVATGLVASLARPGGNVTGFTNLAAELSGKRLELLRQMIPGLSRVGLLIHGTDPLDRAFVDGTRTAAAQSGIQVRVSAVPRAADLDAALAGMAKERVAAVIIPANLPVPIRQITDLALRHRLPSISLLTQFAEAGGLMSYGASVSDIRRRTGAYVDKLLKGARPGDLPVEQPTKFELIINLKAAKQIGLTIPPNVLARADKVIR